MVTAGVYMVTRHAVAYLASPQAMAVVAVIGAATALWAALFGLAARELKQVLAYSTVSQLGYMFLGLGVGAFSAGIFHLVTHAFFKALLFLGAGAVMHACADVQELDRIGGLRKYMPQTHLTFWAGALALAGIVPFAGFWSKDAILYGAWSTSLLPAAMGRILWAVGLGAAAITAFYTLRLVARTFWGREKVPEGAHPHEQPPVMTIPLWVLAAGSLLAGFLLLPEAIHAPKPLGRALESIKQAVDHTAGASGHAVHHHAASTEWALMAVATVVAVAGAALAWWVYSTRLGKPAVSAAGRLPAAFRWLREAGYVDQVYWGWILYPYRRACGWLGEFDRLAVDGTVRLSGFGTEMTGLALRFVQTGRVRSYLLFIFGGVLLVVLYCLFVP
jgi:NADH-quinone oxidoreductase subunit L